MTALTSSPTPDATATAEPTAEPTVDVAGVRRRADGLPPERTGLERGRVRGDHRGATSTESGYEDHFATEALGDVGPADSSPADPRQYATGG